MSDFATPCGNASLLAYSVRARGKVRSITKGTKFAKDTKIHDHAWMFRVWLLCVLSELCALCDAANLSPAQAVVVNLDTLVQRFAQAVRPAHFIAADGTANYRRIAPVHLTILAQ
jgi:hypothetical protein